MAKVKKEREEVQNKLNRMVRAFIDGLFPEAEYHRQKKLLEMELESLVVPQANVAEEAGKLIMDLPRLWHSTNLDEQGKLLPKMLKAVYVYGKKSKSIVAIKPKPPFIPIFQVAASRQGSDIRIVNEPLKTQSGSPVVFLVEAGEGQPPPETRFKNIIDGFKKML